MALTWGSSQTLLTVFLDIESRSSSCSPVKSWPDWVENLRLVGFKVMGMAIPANLILSKSSKCFWTFRKLLSYFSRRE